MSTVDTSQTDWTNISEQKLDSKYEKCRNITEEIYKRINITFQIKKLEAGQSELSDNSDLIDSNELSNETDLFACDKSDLTSSSEAQKPTTDCGKFINNNNNEERAKIAAKRPKKRLRKRVKKRQLRARSVSEGSSDEAPLSRIADPPTITHANIDAVLKQKIEKKPIKKEPIKKPPAKTPQKKQLNPEKKTIDFSNKSLSVRLDKLPIPLISMKDDTVKNYRSYMKDNKLTIKNETSKEDYTFPIDTSTDKLSMKTDKLSMKTDKLSMKTDKLSMKTDKLSLKTDAVEEEKEARKSCSLCSLTFRGERGLRRHMSMSHILPENCK